MPELRNEPVVTPAGAPVRSRRWPAIYYALAAFDVLTVCVSLYVGYRILDVYEKSVAVNLEYSNRRRDITELDELATAANSPGNDVFETRDINDGLLRLSKAVVAFNSRINDLRADFTGQIPPAESPLLLAKLDDVQRLFDEMVAKSRAVFEDLKRSDETAAGKHMAEMDRKHALIIKTLGDLRADLRALEKKLFAAQEQEAAGLQSLEYVIAFFVLLMVAAATFYGHKLAQKFESDALEKEKYLTDARTAQEQLRQSNENLESRVQARTAELASLNTALAAEVSERKRNEQALRESEEKWRSVVENAPDIIMTCDRSGKILFANHVVPGLSVEQVIGTYCFDYVPPETRERLKGYIDHVFETGEPVTYEVWGTGPNDSIAAYSSRLGPIRQGGKVTAAIMFVSNVTDQKKAAEELRQADQRMKMAVEAAQLGTWHWDIERDSITMTAGMPPLGPKGKKVATLADFLQTVVPEDRKLVEDRIQRAIEDGKDYNAEFRVRRDDGMRWIAIRGQVIRNAEGRIVALTGVDMDITDRKEAEEERRRLEAQIQHSQKLESLGVLAGGIAHDFNNLLAAMLGNASLALLELPPESPALKSIQNIQTASQRAAELCRQMLAYSGKGKFVVEAISLNRLVEEMGHLLQACISKNVTLKYKFTPDLPLFYADATQVRQVIMNMITNASEAIDQKPGTITLSTGIIDASEQYLATCYPAEQPPPGRYLYADVCDDGCGMTPETLARIFDPFFSTKFTGRGLGLAAVLGIMRGHRGTVKVTSEPGKGTCFRALFPAITAHPRTRPATTQAPIADWRGSGTVLVVDDEECIRSVAQNILHAFGFKVLSASDGEESLAVLRDNKDAVTAVLLDMTMPRMDGETAFRELRAIRPDLRIILSSGFTEQEVAARFADKPVAGFVQKPYTASDLIQKLRVALNSN